ncbi:MAG: nitroreductase family protein [Candidatus Hydrogenedentes bacterium]|nr:nitroreductase family protein [Candidatus Hydrogenedentota bacterium]
MNFDDVVRARRSVRGFDGRPVKREDILAMCESARLAPSACNSQTWRFVAVTDRNLLDRICREGMRTIIRNKWLREAPLIIAGCSKLDLVANRLGTKVTGIEYYRIDLGIAMEHMVLKATELGLGTCWIGWFREDKIKEILDIPKNVRVSVLLAVGYPRNDAKQKTMSRHDLDKILFFDKWR